MKLASSIKYGGQLIDADDVDYSAYRNLGLLCPNCKDPVFLQTKSMRNIKTIETEIPAHFKHFPTKEPALIKECEMRVAKYDSKEIQRQAAKARNQRLKLLQRWFWEVFYTTGEYDKKCNSNESLSQDIRVMMKTGAI